jgi:hypothetical protein
VKNQIGPKFGLLVTLTYSGTYIQSFGSIAPAVTKRALLTDDNDDYSMGSHRFTRCSL